MDPFLAGIGLHIVHYPNLVAELIIFTKAEPLFGTSPLLELNYYVQKIWGGGA